MKAVRHTGIVVHDLPAMRAFYTDLLGLRAVREADEQGPYLAELLGLPGGRVRTVKLAADDGSLVELLHFREPAASPAAAKSLTRNGITHLAFTVADLAGLVGRLIAAGFAPVSPVQTAPDGAARVVFVCDPEGNYLELVEELPPAEG